MSTDDLCAVCLEAMRDDETMTDMSIFPGCKHRFHSVCMLNFTQYDIRCPTCRQVPAGVTVRTSEGEGNEDDESNIEMDSLREELRIAQRAWNAYENRRRKCIRRHPAMRQAANRVRQMHSEIAATYRDLQRSYDAKCKLIWKTDDELGAYKKRLTCLHRNKRRTQYRLESDVVAMIGSRPEITFL